MNKTFWIVYNHLRKKYPRGSTRKCVYITHKLVNK